MTARRSGCRVGLLHLLKHVLGYEGHGTQTFGSMILIFVTPVFDFALIFASKIMNIDIAMIALQLDFVSASSSFPTV